jgi:hypothetical protein
MRLLAGVAMAFAASLSAASAQPSGVEVGKLECRGKATSYIISSVTELHCVFRRSYGGRPDSYYALVRRYGLDINLNQSTGLAWLVFAPSRYIGPGSLAGYYGGASANATVGVGVGANVLFGGSNNTYALQPVSVQGQLGLGAAAGITGLELRAYLHRKRYRRR